jgi:hypothetical protein
MYSPKMRRASSTARTIVSWSGLFITARNSNGTGIQARAGEFVPGLGTAAASLGCPYEVFP